MADRTPVSQHIARVNALLAPLRERGAETLPLLEALGRVTADDIRSPIPLPPFRNSQMDGFAVRATDVARASEREPVVLPIQGSVAAAAGTPDALEAGTAIRIMTGAPVPEGADAIVPVEDTTPTGADGVERIAVNRARTAGEYVREPGSDLAADAVLLPAGTRLASRHLAALAAAGLAAVTVRARVRIGVVSTGSELVNPGETLGPGQIPDSNGTAIAAAVLAAGGHLVSQKHAPDTPAALAEVFDRAIDAGAELLLTSGGVSMGDHEVVRQLLEPLGAHVDSLAMQPGGPQAVAEYRGVPVVCFPGNPVSSQLSFALFVAPLLRELAGLPEPRRATLALEAAVTSIPGRRQFLRGRRLDGEQVATVSGPGSHLVAALAASDLIIDIPEDTVHLAAGDPV
ncbi:MAG TPA: gephyrin-like molybdotransferase Glp, partial [Pseudolysinimonas sp.]|nr:gephyrin-like molybdotransferase Glp [Pseudolysinimonas sp.]